MNIYPNLLSMNSINIESSSQDEGMWTALDPIKSERERIWPGVNKI